MKELGINELSLKKKIDPYLLECTGEVFSAILYFHAIE
jgi:hypothetical protein